MNSNTSPKKPSPLSQSTPSRQSPFRRAASPSNSPATIRPESPHASPAPSAVWSPRSPGNMSKSPANGAAFKSSRGGADPLSKLHPAQLREMRESFQTLDRDNDGSVNKDDVKEMLNQLGQSSNPSDLSAFFTASSTVNLATYLNSFASLLSPMSRPDELSAAFAAFDVDDSGQVDVGELRTALLHTAPEPGDRKLTERDINSVLGDFSGRRAFKRGMGTDASKRGDVFRYEEFITSMAGGGNVDAEGEVAA